MVNLLDLPDQFGNDLVEISADADMRHVENRSGIILIDGDDMLAGIHAGCELNGAGNAAGDQQLGLDGPAGQADLPGGRGPSLFDKGPGNSPIPMQRFGQILYQLQVAFLLQSAAARDQDLGILDRFGRRDRDAFKKADGRGFGGLGQRP